MLMLIKIVRMKGRFNKTCTIDDDTLKYSQLSSINKTNIRLFVSWWEPSKFYPKMSCSISCKFLSQNFCPF